MDFASGQCACSPVKQVLVDKCTAMVDYPPYSPDCGPRDFATKHPSFQNFH